MAIPKGSALSPSVRKSEEEDGARPSHAIHFDFAEETHASSASSHWPLANGFCVATFSTLSCLCALHHFLS